MKGGLTRPPVRIAWTDHLVELVGQAAAAAARIAGAPDQARRALATSATREWARLSARLDGSPLTEETAAAIDAGAVPAALAARVEAHEAKGPDPSGGWATALRLDARHLDQLETQDVAAIEYANLLTCAQLEPQLTQEFFERPRQALTQLHAAICRGLVAPDVLGRPRRTAQAVHDGAQGHVLYYAADPDTLPDLLDAFGRWLADDSATLPTLVLAGVVHERLLEWQPFEAGNGRLARAASRVVLRARGLDPDGLAVPERLLAADATGYYREVSATRRRRGELSGWLERYGEALVAGLESAAKALVCPPAVEVPRRAMAVIDGLAPPGTITLREYAEAAGVTFATARNELQTCVVAGVLERQPRASGLRFRLPAGHGPTALEDASARGVRTDGAGLRGGNDSMRED